ncbi:hypothetical protein [Flavobacterium sp. UBA6135]|uniref:hypothetical protein n=1 Tax=Flavobacterium sp. UBA6135 TaxID=1946553 RepID=UPI0025C0088A|nr:hypothetical protein [Flavobacterium sp. UBA6135]
MYNIVKIVKYSLLIILLVLYKFVVAVDELEKRTGIDFCSQLPDCIENELENSVDYKKWSFN